MEEFNRFILKMKSFSPSMRQIARLLLANEQGGPLAQMCISPHLPSDNKILSAVVVHAVSVFTCTSKQPILHPFIKMLSNPAALLVRNSSVMHDLVIII